jgi:predicted ester cyclase
MTQQGIAAGLARRMYEEVFDGGNLAAIDELVADEFANFSTPGEGRATWRRIATMWRTAFPDWHTTIDDEILAEEVVVHRVTITATHSGELRHPLIGVVQATGRRVEGWDQIHIWRARDGRLAEHWGTRNDLKMLQQIGAVPVLGQTESLRAG